MRVVWSAAAQRARWTIYDHIKSDNLKAAVQMDLLFDKATEQLAEFPMCGRAGAVEGTREIFPHRSYRLIYQVQKRTVQIVTLLHTARLWPPE